MEHRNGAAHSSGDAFRAAQLYYAQGLTMDDVAAEMETSRSSISRLLRHARQTGIVEIKVNSPLKPSSDLERRLAERYGITAHVVSAGTRATEAERLERTTSFAAHRISALITANMKVGVAWGATLSRIARALPFKSAPGAQIIQMNGAASSSSSGVDYADDLLGRIANAFDAAPYHFTVPAIFDDPATRSAMWRERSVRRTLNLQSSADLFVFGLGSRLGDPRSHIYSGGYIDREDLKALVQAGAAGDCATVFYRADGSTNGISINDRTSGPSVPTMKGIPHRLCVVSGNRKRDSLRGALAAGLITELIVDDKLALAVLEREAS